MPELEKDKKSIEMEAKETLVHDTFEKSNTILDIDIIDKETALHYACKFGDIILIRSLVGNYKANVNAINHGKTPLHYAVEFSKDEVVSFLVSHYNARKDIRDYSGKLPIDWAKLGNLEAMERILGKVHYRSIVKEEKAHPRKLSSRIKTLGSMLSHDNSRKTFMSLLKGTSSFSSGHGSVSPPSPSIETFGSRNFLSLPNTRHNKPKIRKPLSPRGDKSPYKDDAGLRESFTRQLGLN